MSVVPSPASTRIGSRRSKKPFTKITITMPTANSAYAELGGPIGERTAVLQAANAAPVSGSRVLRQT